MGHAKVGITLDRYGHLMPGSEDEAAELLDGYLAAQRKRAEDAARSAGNVQNDGRTGEQTGEQNRDLALLEDVDRREDDSAVRSQPPQWVTPDP